MVNIINLPTYEQVESVKGAVLDLKTTSGVVVGSDGKSYKAIIGDVLEQGHGFMTLDVQAVTQLFTDGQYIYSCGAHEIHGYVIAVTDAITLERVALIPGKLSVSQYTSNTSAGVKYIGVFLDGGKIGFINRTTWVMDTFAYGHTASFRIAVHGDIAYITMGQAQITRYNIATKTFLSVLPITSGNHSPNIGHIAYIHHDGSHLYALCSNANGGVRRVYKLNPATGQEVGNVIYGVSYDNDIIIKLSGNRLLIGVPNGGPHPGILNTETMAVTPEMYHTRLVGVSNNDERITENGFYIAYEPIDKSNIGLSARFGDDQSTVYRSPTHRVVVGDVVYYCTLAYPGVIFAVKKVKKIIRYEEV